MKIALVNMPWNRDGKQGIRAGSRWPHLRDDPESNYLPYPFFLGYSASLLRVNGFDVKFIDAIAEQLSLEECLDEIQDFAPDLFVAETSTVSFQDDIGFLLHLDKNIKIALCGPDANIYDPHFLAEYGLIDFVLKGEYEFTLLDLVRALNDNTPLSEIAGINYRSADNCFYVNPLRTLGDINKLPWPERDGLPMERYIDSPGAMPFPTVQMLASRGCPFGCKFCLWPQVMYGGRNYRMRDVHDVLDEMESMVRDYKFKSVYFDDDTFGVRKEWLAKFCEELIKRNNEGRINVPWAMMTRTDVVDEELLYLLKEAGLHAVKYGMESGNQELVDCIGKDLKLTQAKEIIRLTHSLGIKTHLTFTFGLPGETRKTAEDTIRTAIGLDPYSIQFSIMTPFPGTDFFDEREKEGFLLSKDWSKYNGSTQSVIRTKALGPKALVRIRNRAYKIWNRHVKLRNIQDRIDSGKFGGVRRLFFGKTSKDLVYLFFITGIYYGYLAFANVVKRQR